MKRLSIYITFFSLLITLGIGVYTLSSPVTAAAIAFIVWSISPYLYLAALVNLVSNKTSMIAALIMTVSCCGLGLLLMIDAMFIYLDAQSALVYAVAPLWQWAGLLVVTFPLIILNKVKSEA